MALFEMGTARVPYTHQCFIEGCADSAPFGFRIRTGVGPDRTIWACGAHRADGERLFSPSEVNVNAAKVQQHK
jgi:hypothetical protein